MKRFLTRKELKLKKKQSIYAAIGIVIIIALYLFLTREKHVEPEAPIVCVAPVQQQDVELYGEYVAVFVRNNSSRSVPCGRFP